MNTLEKGKKYEVEDLKFLGWTNGLSSDLVGYNYMDYFDCDGTYLGPDQYSIEPVFSGYPQPEE